MTTNKKLTYSWAQFYTAGDHVYVGAVLSSYGMIQSEVLAYPAHLVPPGCVPVRTPSGEVVFIPADDLELDN